MQALCVFAHAVEVSARENQWIRRRIVHGRKKNRAGIPLGFGDYSRS